MLERQAQLFREGAPFHNRFESRAEVLYEKLLRKLDEAKDIRSTMRSSDSRDGAASRCDEEDFKEVNTDSKTIRSTTMLETDGGKKQANSKSDGEEIEVMMLNVDDHPTQTRSILLSEMNDEFEW
jgi:hypothetical protein